MVQRQAVEHRADAALGRLLVEVALATCLNLKEKEHSQRDITSIIFAKILHTALRFTTIVMLAKCNS